MTTTYSKYSRKLISIFLSVTLLSPGLYISTYAKESGRTDQEKPLNVLFIVSDDLRPNLGCYGDMQAVTPNIDRMAEAGVLFTNAYCQQAVCNPSRASLLTGLRPDESGVVDLVTHFRTRFPDLVTLPQLFKNNGYLSIGIGKVFHTRANTLDPVSWSEPVPEYDVGRYISPENLKGGAKQNATESPEVADTAYEDGKVTKDAIRFLTKAKADNQPFFLAVGFKKPHAPYCAPRKYWDIYENTVFDIQDRERPDGSPGLAFHSNNEIRGYQDIPKEGPIPSGKEQLIIQGYYACISYVDAQVGMILDELESLGLAENTIVVFWGDHGYHLGEQDTWCKSTNFELDARSPLIIAAPSMAGNGQKSDAIVEFVDVYPTLADLAGLKPQGKLSGSSLVPLLDNRDKNWKNVAFNQFVRPYNAIFDNPPKYMGYSVRTEQWRCTYWWDLSSGEIVERELYHLGVSGIEKENLAGRSEFSADEKQLAELLSNYRDGNYKK